MITIEIYTDGSCNQKIGTGGWSFFILENGKEKIKKSEPEIDTTNNKMEMLAVIKAFEELEKIEFFEPISVTVLSDSAYVVNGFVQDWISGWLKNGWINSKKEPVANKELWQCLIDFQKKYKADFVQIKRRSDKFAIHVDEMAKKSSKSIAPLG